MRVALAGLVLAALTFTLAQTRVDVDLWGHIRFGLDIVDARALHDVDPYSFTSDRPWINHEWLAEVIFALAWRYGGTPGLIAVKLACAFGALALMGSALHVSRISRGSSIFLLGLTLLGILPRIAQVRPQLFSVLLFAALVRIFVQSRNRGTRALLWSLPVVCLWANLHGGWLVGAASTAIWCFGAAYGARRDLPAAAAALATGAGSLAVTLVNPYGAELWRFLFETVGFGRDAIREWGPAWTNPATALIWVVFALLLGAALIRLPRIPRNPAVVIVPLGFAAASLKVSRLDAFFAMTTIGLLAGPVSSLFERRARAFHWSRSMTAAAVAIAIAVISAIPAGRRAFTCISFYEPRWPEPEAVEFIHERQLSGRLVTYFDWGEYAIWHLPPMKVSIDGRRETVFSDRVITGHVNLYNGDAKGLAYLGELRADYAWLPRGLPVVDSLVDRGWVRIFDGPRSVVLSAAGTGGGAPPFKPKSLPARDRCFPGP